MNDRREDTIRQRKHDRALAQKGTERPQHRVLLMRIAFALAVLGMLVGWSGAMYSAWKDSSTGFVVFFLIAFPSIAFVVLTSMSCGALYFDYSLMGRQLPAAPPPNWRCMEATISGIVIGDNFHATTPLVQWAIGPGGVRIRILYYPPVFLATGQVVSITKDSWGDWEIGHASSEIRSPLRVPQYVVEAMLRHMPEIATLSP